jgi:SSS family solute:Na+ symporter
MLRWLAVFVLLIPADPKDLAPHGCVKHDGKRLYFAFDITDDVLYGTDTPERPSIGGERCGAA